MLVRLASIYSTILNFKFLPHKYLCRQFNHTNKIVITALEALAFFYIINSYIS
jgi:hypothetical protein